MSSLGGVLEFYDFIIFGLMSVHFARVILPYSSMRSWNAFVLFLIFILGYMMRPFGMKLYSQCAVHHSSKTMNIVVISILFISSLMIALIPTYSQVGILSAVLLLVARILQGISSGAELQGEHDHLTIKIVKNPSFAILGFLAGNELGQLLGVFVYRGISSFLTESEFNALGWRIPFFINSIFIVIVFILRINFGDPITKPHHGKRSITPSYKLLKTSLKQTLIAITLSGVKGGSIFLYLVLIPFSLWYFIGYDYLQISHIIFESTIISTIFIFFINPWLSFKNSRQITVFTTIFMFWAVLFWAWAFQNGKFVLTSITLIAVASNLFSLTIPRVITGLFPPELRLHGVTFSHQNGFILFGGLIPLFNITVGDLVFYFFGNQIDHKTVFVFAVVLYFLIITILGMISLLNTIKYANYEDLNQLRQLIRNRHTK